MSVGHRTRAPAQAEGLRLRAGPALDGDDAVSLVLPVLATPTAAAPHGFGVSPAECVSGRSFLFLRKNVCINHIGMLHVVYASRLTLRCGAHMHQILCFAW